MKLRIFSDIHNEFHRDDHGTHYHIPEMSSDPETILILAGDIDTKHHVPKFIETFSERFLAVLYVAGNHDLYGNNIDTYYRKTRGNLPRNVFVLQNDMISFDDVTFFGSTLWTDFDGASPVEMFNWRDTMTDAKQIRMGSNYSKLTADCLLCENWKAREFFFNGTAISGKKVAISHHAPTYATGFPQLTGNEPYYHNNMDNILLEYDLWIHGHTHYNVDMVVGDRTRIVTNQKGYSEGVKGFDPYLIVDI